MMAGNFSALIHQLESHKVEYVLVGGYAAMLRGSALMTQDVDVAMRMNPENLVLLYRALESLNPVHRQNLSRPPFTLEQARSSGWNKLYLSTDYGQLDCLGEVTGLGDFAACLALSEVLDLGEFSVRTLTLDSLISAKKAMDRPKDRQAVLDLEVIRERIRDTELL